MDDHEISERVGRVEQALAEIERLDDPARSAALAAVEALVTLYGEGLAHIVDHVAAADDDGALADAFTGDELVSHLLLLHDLHPAAVDERVLAALDGVRPYLRSHGGDVELLAVADGVVRLRLRGSCDGCPSSSMTLRLAVEDAIGKAAPEIERVEAEGVAAPGHVALPLTVVHRNADRDGGAGGWTVAGGLPELRAAGTVRKDVAGEPVLFVGLAADVLAYRDACPACGASLAGGRLEETALACPACGARYDVRRAGRPLDAVDDASLEPLPLLTTDAGLVKVMLPARAT